MSDPVKRSDYDKVSCFPLMKMGRISRSITLRMDCRNHPVLRRPLKQVSGPKRSPKLRSLDKPRSLRS